MTGSNHCPHLFAGKRPDRPHYCTYIQVERLLQTFPPTLANLGDRFFHSFCAASVLWLRLQSQDLKALAFALKSRPVHLNRALALKRLRRAIAISKLLRAQAELTRTALRDAHRQPSLMLANDSVLPLLDDVGNGIENIRRVLQERSIGDHCEWDAMCFSADLLADCQTRYEDLTQEIFAQVRQVEGGRSLSALLDVEALFEAAQISLRRHHPQAQKAGASNDELCFITSHQMFEMWFPTVLKLLDQIIANLLSNEAQQNRAEADLQLVIGAYHLFCQAIQMPQTMTAADYLAFRSQLEGGSGLESVGFRALEITIGQRDAVLLRNMMQLQLTTDELAERLSRPSLSDAYLLLLQRAGIISNVHDMEGAAQGIASVLRPTAAPHPFSGLMALGESLVELEQALESWRHHHISMVDRMIGLRQSLGVAGNDPLPLDQGACPAHGGKRDGRPYLVQTLGYQRVFSYLWDARSRMDEAEMRKWLGLGGLAPQTTHSVRAPRASPMTQA